MWGNECEGKGSLLHSMLDITNKCMQQSSITTDNALTITYLIVSNAE